MTASQDYVALDWIKGEVGQTLEKAQQALVTVSESSDDAEAMRSCLTSIHQVHSTLKMVELSGPVQIAEEMESLAQALMNNSVGELEKGQEALMQSILQLPRYLDRIQKEQKELPQASLSIVNTLRVARGENRLSPEVTGAKEYELSPFSQPLSSGANELFKQEKGSENVPKLRQKYQHALLAFLKKENPRENLTLLGKIFATTGKICSDAPVGHLMNLSLAMIEGVGKGSIKLDNSIGSILKQLDKVLKTLGAGGVDVLGDPIEENLVREILDRICDSDKTTPRMQAVKDRYLITVDVSVEEVDDFAIMGPDEDTIGTVIKILLDELQGVTDKLDLYVRASVKDKQDLVDMVPMMTQIGGTLSMVGMQEYQELVEQQIVALNEMQSSSDEPSEEQLLEMAKAFIELESRLGGIAGESDEGDDSDKLGDINAAHATVAKETRIGLNQCTDAVMEFLSSNFDQEKIRNLPYMLQSLRGGLIIMNQQRAGDVLLASARYVEKILVEGQHTPEEEEVDCLADALTSIDYFLERLLENSQEPYIHMIEVAEESVEKLGFEVSEVLEREADREVQQKVSSYERPLPDGAGEEMTEESSEQAASASEDTGASTEESMSLEVGAEDDQFDIDSLDQDEDEMIDDEIIEIFIEEAAEVLETISEYFPRWKEKPADSESLTEIRRAFHTLKGSGRMVGATVVGELSWAIEDMLNRVLNKSIDNGIEIVDLVEVVVGRIPDGIKAFQEQNQEAVSYEDLISSAEAFSTGTVVAGEVDSSIQETAADMAEVDEDEEIESPVVEEEIVTESEPESEPELELELKPELDLEPVLELEPVPEPELEAVPEPELDSGIEIDVEEMEAEDNLSGEGEPVSEELTEEEPSEIDILIEEDEGDIMAALEALSSETASEENADDVLLDVAVDAGEEEQIEDFLSQDLVEEDHSSLMDDSLDLIDIEEDGSNLNESLKELEKEATNLDVKPDLDLDLDLEEIIQENDSPSDFVTGLDGVGQIDEELSQIFRAEANEHLQQLKDYVELKPGRVTPEVIASFHTLRGSAGMAAIHSVALLAAPLEHLANKYHRAGKAADPLFYDLVQSVIGHIENITAELPSYHEITPALEKFVTQVEELSGPEDDVEESVTFEFEKIRLLTDAGGLLESWDLSVVADLIKELGYVNDEALKSGKSELQSLCGSLLNVYQNLRSKPEVEVLNVLTQAHEVLVQLLDCIAASQDMELPLDVINKLDALEFEQQDNEDLKQLTKEAWEILMDLGASIQKLRMDSGNLISAENAGRYFDELESKILALGIGKLSIITTPMKNICEQLVSEAMEVSSSDIKLMEMSRNEISDQLNRDEGKKGLYIDEALVSLINDRVQKSPLTPVAGKADGLEADDSLEAKTDPARLAETSLDDSSLDVDSLDVDSLDLDSLELDSPGGGVAEAEDSVAQDLEIGDLGIEDLEVEQELEKPVTEEISDITDEIDDEILAMFLEEAEEILEDFDQIIVNWSASPASTENMDALLRHLHTLKGGARMAGLNTLGEYVHNFESELIGIQQVPVPFDDTFYGNLNRQLDEINHRLEVFRKMGAGNATEEEILSLRKGLSAILSDVEAPAVSHLLETEVLETEVLETDLPLNDLLETVIEEEILEQPEEPFAEALAPIQDEAGEKEKIAESATPAATKIDEGIPAVPAKEVIPEQPIPEQPIKEEASEASASPSPAQSQEVIRVGHDVLEDLISLTGESSITRSRVEQQISDFSDSLEEMEATIGRMRNQVRKLEIEAESRETLIRGSEDESSEDFDDLEMDRYTFLQEISRGLSESASDMMDLKDTLANKSRDAELLLHQQARIGGELQEGLTRTRMVPFARLIPRLRRVIRQVSAELGKTVRFETLNVEGELDRTVLDRIVAPLEHMLRNAVDHGIENKEERIAANKPESGRVSLRLSREGGYVVVHISDDGAGIDVASVRRKAIEKGLMPESAKLTDHEVMQFIVHAGFSTAEKLTQISGRGVGMDVVDTEIKQLGGTLTINSKVDVGTEFVIRLPFTVSINRALMVVLKEETYAIPLNTIEGIVRVSPYELEAYYAPDAPMFEYAGQPYKLFYLGKLLDRTDKPRLEGEVSALPVILARSGDQAVALQVDKVIGSREIVSKSLGPQLSDLSGVSGATVLGDGSVVIILDVMSFVRMADLRPREVPKAKEEAIEAVEPEARIRTVMVVDDSVTVRKVTSRLIERQGWEVVTAKDGVDAINQLQDIYPDIMLLDIEMPKMDGFEVLSTVRRDERLKDLPIVMITSRTGAKHKEQAMELGVNNYLGKPFQEASLLSTIEEVLSKAHIQNKE